jgi:ATP-dependent Clp protease ATP-binding subunit ClpC
VHILLRRTKNNPIIIGETGVGKTAIVEGLAQKIVSGDVPKDLQDKRIFQLDVASLVAGASHRGEFEERLRGVISEVLGSNNRIILFIDEIHALLTGDDGGMNAANIIKPHLARGHFQLIGATTTIEYRKNFEKDKAFERRFQPVTAEEPSEENALEMLKVIRPKYEKFHHVTLPDDALKECVKLSKKYIGERYLPDKAVDLLDEASSHVKLEIDAGKRNSNESTVRKADIEKVVSTWTGIPITKLTEDESAKLLKLEDRIHQRLVDQEEAVVAVSEAVRRGRIGLAAANRPIASFVFLGPTGVGKTELAKTLAELLFGRDDSMARLDMSEYMEKHEVAKLIGAPPGYVGYEEGGQLTEAVRKKPYSIVLFDEIEKAHPDVFNILLQLLEDGRLTDNKGNTVSFKNTIIICTSNIGSAVIQQHLNSVDPKAKRTTEDFNKSFKELQGIVREELIKFFRPELLNRFDEVVIFKPLQPEHMAGIARLGIAKTAKLLKEQGYNLQITERAIAQLATDGYDPIYGARPLRRLIQTAIENPIALAIISKKFVPGDTIVIDFSDNTNEFFFSKSGGIADIAPMTDEQFRTFLVELNNPDSVPNVIDRQNFSEAHDLVVKGRTENNKTATAILEVNAGTDLTAIQTIRKELEAAKAKGDVMAQKILDLAATVTHQIQATLELKHILLEIIQPDSIVLPSKRVRFVEMHTKVLQESERQNELALKIMAVNDSTPAIAIDELMEMLKTGAANGEDLATEILAMVNGEITEEAEAIHQAEPLTQFKNVLEQIINPLYLADPDDKAKFSEIHEKTVQASKAGNPVATEILALTDITSDSDIQMLKSQLEKSVTQGDPFAKELMSTINEAIEAEPLRKLKRAILLINNPVSAKSTQEKDQYTELQTKITTAGQKGNQLASEVQSVKEETTNEAIKGLLNKLVIAYPQNDEVAVMVLSLIGGAPVPQTQENAAIPAVQDTTAAQVPAPMGVPVTTGPVSIPEPVQSPTAQFTPPPPPAQSVFAANTPQPIQQSPVSSPVMSGIPPAGPAILPQNGVTQVDSTSGVVGSVVNNNGSMMQPSGAYNYSGIPLSSRPMGYVSPQSRQEDVE